MSEKKSPTAIIKFEAKNLRIDYPKSDYLTEKEMEIPQKAIDKHGVALGDTRTLINKEALPEILCTDKKGANRVYGKIGDSDKFTNGDDNYLTTSSVKKEISERIEEPRNALKRERLKYNEKCVDAFRDADKLENQRSKDEARISHELPKQAKKIAHEKNIDKCEATGEPLKKGFSAHHLDRKADNPRRALDMDNIKIVNDEPHKDIHSKNFEGENGFEEYKKTKK